MKSVEKLLMLITFSGNNVYKSLFTLKVGNENELHPQNVGSWTLNNRGVVT